MKNPAPNIIFVGLTGGIGSGKSLISKIIRNFNFPVYNADENAKLLMENNFSIKKKLLENFGSEIFVCEKLNKSFLSKKIFSSKKMLEKINKIVHKAVFEDFTEWAKSQNSKIVFMESAIIFENSLEKYFHKTISVISPQKIRIQRVMRRSNMRRSEIKKIISTQFSSEKLVKKSDFTIKNNEKEPLLPQIINVLEKL
jgi:dephospho-CoA kinase